MYVNMYKKTILRNYNKKERVVPGIASGSISFYRFTFSFKKEGAGFLSLKKASKKESSCVAAISCPVAAHKKPLCPL